MLPAELTDVGLFGSMSRYGDLSVHAVVDLRRAFDRAALERAIEAAIAAFPVFGCRYEARFFKDRWAPVEGPVGDAVFLADAPDDLEAETFAWTRRRLDPTRERPLRVVQLRRGTGARLILSLQHLASDGGGMAAVGQVLLSSLYGVALPLPTDARRSVVSALGRLRPHHLPVLARDLVSTLLQPWRTARASVRERAFPTHPMAGASARHVVIEAPALASLRERTRASKATVNDLLIAAMACVSGARVSHGSVVVLYTMDLRRYASAPRLTAANTSAILTAVVPRAALGDLVSAAAAVATITAQHRRSLIGPAFLLAPTLMGRGTPHGLIRRMLPAFQQIAVEIPIQRGLVVTNVGRLDDGLRAFDADIEDLRVIGPNIEGVPTPAVVAFGFRGRLHLELFAAPGVAPEALDELERDLREAFALPA